MRRLSLSEYMSAMDLLTTSLIYADLPTIQKSSSFLLVNFFMQMTDLVTHTVVDMQILMNPISVSCNVFGLSISLGRTVVMFQPTPRNSYVEPAILVEGTIFKVVDKSVYFAGTLACSCSLR